MHNIQYIIIIGDCMRVYYVFYINNYFSYVYKNKPYKLYKIIEEMYHVKEYDMVLTYRFYEQIAIPFDKQRINEYIYNRMYKEHVYYKRGNIHMISSSVECSKLVVTNSNLKIKTNVNYCKFFNIVNEYSDNIFICDFVNKDYFWLDKLFKSDCQTDKYLVK